MAPQDNLSPAGSSTYSSNTMYVGDGTWDATRNDFLLPNLVGLNFETMRYNGMGNRFAGLPQYHQLIKGHGIVAVITFLFIVPSAILIRAFYGRSEFWAMRMHIYLQILTVALTTVVFTLGWFAVGPERSLTNPHHGIGLAIYVLVLWQAITGWWMYGREKGRGRRKTVKKVLHQWLGRATALLAFAQVPLGLTLYGSPKWTFILYALWMFFLLVLFFILSYRAQIPIDTGLRASSHGGTVIEDRKPSRFGGLFGPLAAGAGAAALLSARKNRNRSRSRSRSRVEVIPSRRGSGSYIEEEKYDSRRRKDEGGGMMDKLLKGAAVLGAAGLAKSWYDGRKRRREEDTYSSVAPDTPSRRHDRRRRDSDSTESVEVHRMEEGRTNRPILPGPGDPVLAAAAMSAATPRPVTPRPVRPGARRDSYDSDSYYDYESTLSPSRRPQSTHKVRNGLLAGLGVGWFAKKMKDRRDRKEEDRLARIEDERIEEERRARRGQRPQRLTGDGFPASRHGRRGSRTQSSDLSSVIDNPHDIRPGGIPPVPAGFGAGAAAGAAINQSQSRHDITHSTEPVSMPPAPHDPQGILHPESGSESYMSPGGHPHRRHSERRRREGEAAMAAAVGAAATLAAEEERRRQRSQSRHEGSNVASPPVSVKVKVHDDKDRHVTLRRLTEQEAAAEREARRSERHRRRADSLSSLSGTDTGASRRRYRRDERDAERRAETSVPPPPPPPPPVMEPLSPPNPAFAGGRRPKDSAYYSGRPGEAGASGTVGASSVNSPESHATWSAMSPDASQGDGAEAAAERRRRRRLERNARNHPGGGTGTVDFT